MRLVRILPVALLTLAGSLLAAPSSQAAVATVRGQVDASAGYRVVLVRADGSSQQTRLASTGAFTFRGSSSRLRGATLHLLTPQGRYFGPLVLRWNSTRRTAQLELSGQSTALGHVRRRVGHARVLRPAAVASVLLPTVPTTLSGAPLGAGRLGLVRRIKFKSRDGRIDPAPALNGADTDADGLVNAFDIDDDGDLRLDATDPATSISADESPFQVRTNLVAEVADTINANAGGIDPVRLEALYRRWLIMNYAIRPTLTAGWSGVVVECFGLRY
jgi:hypothetical protein